MTDAQHFGRAGEKREFRFADEHCIRAVCWIPLVLIEKRMTDGDREHCGCRSKMTGECPSPGRRAYSDKLEKERRRAGWVERG